MLFRFFRNKLLSDNSVIVTNRILSLFNINVSIDEIKLKILSHQNQGSLLAIYEAFEAWNIEVSAFKAEQSELNDFLNNSVMQIVKNGTPYFIVTKDINDDYVKFYNERNFLQKLTRDEFLKIWTGVVLKINKSSISSEYRETNQFDKLLSSLGVIIFGISLYLFSSNNIVFHFQESSLLLYLLTLSLSFIGGILGVVLIWHEIDKYNPVVKSLCSSSSKKVNCDSVLESKGAKLFNGFANWSEIGFSYFLALISFQVFYFDHNFLFSTLLSISTLSLIFTLFSIGYQKFVVKEWCFICLMVQFVLLFQFAILFFLSEAVYIFNLSSLLKLLLFILTYFVLIKATKPLLKGKKSEYALTKKYNKMKRNKELFFSALGKTQQVQSEVDGVGIDVGKKEAKYSVIKVCNPYCGPCNNAHPILDKLLNDGMINLKFIFNSRPNFDNERNRPAFHFVAVKDVERYSVKEVLDYWYESTDKSYDKMKEIFPVDEELILTQKEEILKMRNWCETEKITHTPSIFIDNRKLPESYDISDLPFLLT